VPQAGDHVCIPDVADTNGITFSTSTTSIASLESAEQLTVSGGTLELTSTTQGSKTSRLTLSGGTLSGAGSLTIPTGGSASWTGGAMTGSGKTVISGASDADPEATLEISGASSKSVSSGRTLENHGNATFTSTASIDSGTGAIIENSGTFDLQNDSGIFFQGGTLKGVGTVEPALTVSGGQVVPGLSPGIMKVTGSYAQSPGSTLEVEIGGTTSGTGHDQLDVGTTTSLGGTLDIVTSAGFTPSADDSFTIIKCGAANCPSGQFDTVQGANLGPDLDYQVHYNATDVTLVFVDNRMVDTSLTLTANPKSLVFGESTTLSGRLTKTASVEGISGKEVILEHKPAGAGEFAPLGNPATTNADGDFSFTNVRPSKNTEYRARFAGDQASKLNASTSNVQLVKVKIKLTVTVTPTTVKLGEKPVISGVVRPVHTGSVKVTIKRGTTTLVNRKSVPLINSRYRYVYNKPPSTGTYTVIVSFVPTDGDHLGNTVTKRFKVTR
jgi:hypothetical protein